ncbi:MAG: hypothetical protein NZ580_05930 [Bacteroidia bacterium]|nr:hypothetical protein [Bacteroidia bacterium]MDW8236415.1 hypothetical protein [Bacteroidia bacterium]
MKVWVYSPQGILHEGEATRIAGVSVEGSFEILEKHAPFIAQLVEAPLVIEGAQGKRTFQLVGGFLWVSPTNETRVLALTPSNAK